MLEFIRETRPKAPEARQTNAEVRERMCYYVTEARRRITRQMVVFGRFLEQLIGAPRDAKNALA